MKRILMITLAIGITAVSSMGMAAMSTGKVRKEARFLTDKMAYELNMNSIQYSDAYEINFDFIYSARYLMDDVLRGELWAMDRYYHLLDVRNDDLRWVLSDRQYRKFIGIDYFYRPIYTRGNNWHFRVYITYNNHKHFYFGKPHHYTSYQGGHYRTHHNNVSYYRGRHNHNVYAGTHSVRDSKVYVNNRRSDFGTVNVRPGTEKPRSNSGTVRTSRPDNKSNSVGNSSRRSSTGSSVKSTGSSNRANVSPGTGTSRNNKTQSSSVRNNSSSKDNKKGRDAKESGSSVKSSSSERKGTTRSSSGSSRSSSGSSRSSSGSSSTRSSR